MPQPVKHVPKHRQPKHRQPSSRTASRAAVRTVFVLSAIAVAGTGSAAALGGMVLAPDGDDTVVAADAVAATLTKAVAPSSPAAAAGAAGAPGATAEAGAGTTGAPAAGASDDASAAGPAADPAADLAADKAKAAAALEAGRADPVSRSDRRGVADPLKAAALSLGSDTLMDRTEDSSGDDPRTIARMLLSEAGFSTSQFGCLDSLWTRESGWNSRADNPSSSAYGIPQALPGSKMSSFGSDWATNPVTQIRWGLDYISDRYGSPCGAWAHSESNGWY